MKLATDRESLTVNAWRIAILLAVIAIWQWGWDYNGNRVCTAFY